MKVLVFLKDFYMGGIQRSGVNFCNFLALHGVDVEVATVNSSGPLFKDLNKKIKVIHAYKSLMPFGVSKKQSKEMGAFFFLKRNFMALFSKVFSNKLFLKTALKKQPILQTEYDVAISFSPSANNKSLSVVPTEFVLQKTKAKNKYVFVHSDFSMAKELNNKYCLSQLEKFDKILCVSKSCAETFKKQYPKLSNKVDYLYNFCDVKGIIKQSEENLTLERDDTKINIISVSRLSAEKAFMRSLNVFKKLIDEGQTNFLWHILGDGNERDSIEKFIKQNNMEGYVKLYGNQTNPYPYMKQADLFYLGSYNEAAPMVYAESMILRIPVLTTKTCSAEELVGEYGFVCENNDEGIYKAFKQLLNGKDMLKDKKVLLKGYTYRNDLIKEKWQNIIQ